VYNTSRPTPRPRCATTLRLVVVDTAPPSIPFDQRLLQNDALGGRLVPSVAIV
jgi:hypothetical protein